MAGLLTDDRIAAPDDLYGRLVEVYGTLDDEQAELFNARLLLLLVNHIGDAAVIEEAIERARAGGG
jgi:hypothetical protein